MQLNSRNDAAYWAKVPGLSGIFKIKIFSRFGLLVKFRYKYCKSNISYELDNVKVLTC